MADDTWFEDLNGNPVSPDRSGCIFVIDPNRELETEWIHFVCQPDPWETVIRTNADCVEALAAFSGAMPSRGQARKNGFGGPIPWGLELLGTKVRSFWSWSPSPPPAKPTIGKRLILTSHWFAFFDEMHVALGWSYR